MRVSRKTKRTDDIERDWPTVNNQGKTGRDEGHLTNDSQMGKNSNEKGENGRKSRNTRCQWEQRKYEGINRNKSREIIEMGP